MKIHYFIESCWCSVSSLKETLADDFKRIISDLARRGIYKEENENYRIEYVGIIAFNKIILAILPKFLARDNNITELKQEKKQEQELKIVMQVLKTHARKNNNSILNNLIYSTSLNDNENTTNRLALIDDILRDYMQNGLYRTNKQIEEINGDGEINWETTIEQEQAHIINNVPIYLNLHTNYMISDNDHYITRLHKYILIKAKEELETFPLQTILKDLIDVPNFDFTYNTDHFINKDIMNNAIDHELQDVLHERKTILLNQMKQFINEEESHSEKSLKLWGVNKFWSVWESICKDIFTDQTSIYNDKITKPYYQKYGFKEQNKVATLIPDIITKLNNSLLIIDAKYYNFTFDNNGVIVGKPPELDSIVKQFSYELALKYMKDNNQNNNIYDYDKIHNFFCIPTYESTTKIIGSIHFPIFHGESEKVIKIIQLSHTEVFNMYINNKAYPQTFYDTIL